MIPTKRLLKLLVHEISVVGKPAVPRAQIMLMKADTRDAFQKADAAVAEYRPDSQVDSAIEMARVGLPMPRKFWLGVIEEVGRQVAPDWPPSAQMGYALRTSQGGVLLKALMHAPGR